MNDANPMDAGHGPCGHSDPERGGEKIAKEQHKSRHDVGREAFIAEVWKWKEQSHSIISSQLKKLGSSCDWDRERFTMDEGLSRGRAQVFVQLYSEGLITGQIHHQLVPSLPDPLSDEEPNTKRCRASSIISNTLLKPARIRKRRHDAAETMLGDTAVAVNPADDDIRPLWAQRSYCLL